MTEEQKQKMQEGKAQKKAEREASQIVEEVLPPTAEPVIKVEAPIVEKVEQPKFTQVIYVSKWKAPNIPVKDKSGNEKIYSFVSNGKCGTYTARTQEEIDLLEASPWFQKEFWRAEGGTSVLGGAQSRVVVGARSALLGQLPEVPRPVDLQLQKFMVQSMNDVAQLKPAEAE